MWYQHEKMLMEFESIAFEIRRLGNLLRKGEISRKEYCERISLMTAEMAVLTKKYMGDMNAIGKVG